MTDTVSPQSRGRRLLGTVALGLWALALAGCDGPLSPNLGATGADNIPSPDFAARGPIPKGRYGDLTGSPRQDAAMYRGSAAASGAAPPAAAVAVSAADAASPAEAVATVDGVTPAGNGYQLNFESADVGAVAKAILGDILHANFLVDKRVVGQVTLTSSQPVAKARLVPLLETALSSLGATVVKDQDLYRVVPTADPGGIGTVTGREVGEGYGTSVITARYMPAANLGKLLEGFGSRPGSIKTDPGTNLVIITGTASERRSAIEAANTVDVDWLRSKSVAILPVANTAPDTIISELNRIIDSGEGGMAQGAIQLQPMTRANAVLAVARTGGGIDLVRKWVARLDRGDAGAGGVKVYKLQYAQAKAVAAALNDLFGSGGGGGSSQGDSDKDQLEPSGYGSVSSQAPATGGTRTGTGSGTGATLGGGGGADAANGGAGSPFGVLKAAMASGGGGGGSAAASSADTAALRGGGGAGGGAKVRVTADPNSNSLLINASAPDYKLIERAIHQMDRQPVQVDIEATIAEVTLTDQLQYGVQFFLQGNRTLGLSGAQNLQVSSLNTAGLNLLAGGLASPRVLVNALQGYTSVKILSSPSLVVLDRQPAVLQVGNQVPILTRTAQSTENSLSPVVNNVDYKDTGIILNVLPKVNANGVVTLDIEQQVSAVVATDSSTLTPTISQRRVRSSVAVSNGQTVMLAGLISDTRSNDRSGIPGVGSIAFLNDLLTSHDSAVNRTEIIIFIKPQIISNAADAEQVTEEFHDRLQSMQRTPDRPIVRRY
ncbi:type II secretion system secretin GspD [Lichenibacterium minor]|uniref:type II secretion system secretin GspD n=1 Tax=Lichenibacterium minor TaxID=2316528 RepID=UPI0013ED4747|nr:type II secretion system secretin GspD [Lichenibacterium minor]